MDCCISERSSGRKIDYGADNAVILILCTGFRLYPVTPATFQEVILRLQDYWAQLGCVVLQPLDMEVGAGTFHPATFLRALGPENWNAAYVQPSRRPADGRYGENPNRLQHYYQFQVVMKPSPRFSGLVSRQPLCTGRGPAGT